MKSILKSISAVAAMLLFTTNVSAQERAASTQQMMTPTDLADAKAGECYAQVYSPATYENTTRRVLKSEASFRLEAVPAQYETVTEKVLVKEAAEKLEVIPAVYENVNERIITQEASTRIEPVPAKYETVSEKIEIKPARQVWKSTSGMIYGTAVKDDDGKLVTRPSASGDVLCLVDEPAEYKTVSKKVLKSEATTREVQVPAEYKTITKRVVKSPASTRKVAIPAEYDTVTKRVLKTPASTRRVEIPAEYETVTERVLSSEATMAWVPVLCEVNVTPSKVRQIQTALRSTGHYTGSVDGVFGQGTSAAIASFQRDKKLSQGYGLTVETLTALNVSN